MSRAEWIVISAMLLVFLVLSGYGWYDYHHRIIPMEHPAATVHLLGDSGSIKHFTQNTVPAGCVVMLLGKTYDPLKGEMVIVTDMPAGQQVAYCPRGSK